MERLPGWDLIAEGMRDLAAGRRTAAAYLVAIGAPRLRRLGLPVPEVPWACPEHDLYLLLAGEDAGSAHSRCNALLRRLVSFERCAECAR